MVENVIPKVFISYSWTKSDLVLQVANRLMSHGIEVVLDKWDLKEGQDKYVFMEQCVNNSDITKVLIFCDKTYTEKANNRTGGVGDETVIISSEVYGKVTQEKFIPIITERDEEGKEYVPAYIKARIYIDFSNSDIFEEEYEKLVRNIYNKPLYRKPKLGKQPEWLDEEKSDLFPLTDLIRQIKGATSDKKKHSCANRFIDAYIEALKSYYKSIKNAGEEVYNQFLETKSIRDIFLDFLPALDEAEISISEVVCPALEKMYNELTSAYGFESASCQASDWDYEVYHIFIWELFIAIIAYLRHVGEYAEINAMITYTYFLRNSSLDRNVTEKNYCVFRHYSSLIEENYKPQTQYARKYTLLGDTICSQREKLPIYSSEALAEADLFLYQIRNAFQLIQSEKAWVAPYWFPNLYVYAKKNPTEWTKIKSRKYCKKMFDLFDVQTIEELKKVLSKCVSDKNAQMRYSGCWEFAPAILDVVKLEEVGSLN